MKTTLEERGLSEKYDTDLKLPVVLPVPKVLKTFTDIKRVFNSPSCSGSVYDKIGSGSLFMWDGVLK